MTTLEQAAEKLDFKRILPILVIVLVDLMGLSIIILLLPLFAARFGASPIMIGILQATYPMMQFVGAPVTGPPLRSFWSQTCSHCEPDRNAGWFCFIRICKYALVAFPLTHH